MLSAPPIPTDMQRRVKRDSKSRIASEPSSIYHFKQPLQFQIDDPVEATDTCIARDSATASLPTTKRKTARAASGDASRRQINP